MPNPPRERDRDESRHANARRGEAQARARGAESDRRDERNLEERKRHDDAGRAPKP